jgi:RND superfamily putative drug exporter
VVAVAVLAALTLMPAFMGVAKQNVRAIKDLRAAKRATRGDVDEETAAARLAALTAAADEAHEHSAFARWGRKVSNRPWPWAIAATGVLIALAIPLLSMRLGQLDAGTNPTSETIRCAYDLIATNFGPGANGPLTVVAQRPPGNSPQTNQTLLANTQTTLSHTPAWPPPPPHR